MKTNLTAPQYAKLVKSNRVAAARKRAEKAAVTLHPKEEVKLRQLAFENVTEDLAMLQAVAFDRMNSKTATLNARYIAQWEYQWLAKAIEAVTR